MRGGGGLGSGKVEDGFKGYLGGELDEFGDLNGCEE